MIDSNFPLFYFTYILLKVGLTKTFLLFQMWQDIESVLHPPASSSSTSSNNELVSDRALVHGLVQHSENGGHLSTASPDFTSDFSNRALLVGDPPNAYYSNHYDLGHTSTG